jgi:protoporphyrinogen oxidase
MQRTKFLILGAGPAGLTTANCLLQKGEENFLVLEKENTAGGLCRSATVDDSPLDIGGGHFLDTKRKAVTDFLFSFMAESEWMTFERDSRISLFGLEIRHPLEANIWQLPVEKEIDFLKSIARAGCNIGEKKPQKFIDWINWKLGDEIAANYMIPYNQKMFGNELNKLGTYWLEKLPNVSFEETLKSCLLKKSFGTQPGHSKFYYPKKDGYGEVWQRMARRIGCRLISGIDISRLDVKTKTVNGMFQGDIVINTIPWQEFQVLSGVPFGIRRNIESLKYTSIAVEYSPDNVETAAQWIYCPDEEMPYHRILVRKNFSSGAPGYWTETNKERWVSSASGSTCFESKYAYPLNTIDKPLAIKKILEWMRMRKIYGLGRWGEWEHFNSDVVVERAMELVAAFFNQNKGHLA